MSGGLEQNLVLCKKTRHEMRMRNILESVGSRLPSDCWVLGRGKAQSRKSSNQQSSPTSNHHWSLGHTPRPSTQCIQLVFFFGAKVTNEPTPAGWQASLGRKYLD